MEELPETIDTNHTFWIFGLGVAIGVWLITGKWQDLIIGFVCGSFVWFILVIVAWPTIYMIYKKINKR